MGRTIAAFPWGGLLFASPTVSGLGKNHKIGIIFNRSTYQRSVLTLALLHLGGMGSVLLKSSFLSLSIFVSITGVLLILLLMSGYAIIRFGMKLKSDTLYTEHIRDVQALKDGSKQFLDVVQTTTPTRNGDYRTGHAWAELTARMSHDLRTPLNAVIGFSDLMRAETFGPLGDERYRDYLQHIQDSCRNLLKSTEKTLALTSSLGQPPRVTSRGRISLPTILGNIEEILKAEFKKKSIRIAFVLPSSLDILGERRHIEQILLNVFSEALSHVPEGGALNVTTDTLDSCLCLTLHIENPIALTNFEQASLELCIARLLLEQVGARLSLKKEKEVWELSLFFDPVSEEDLFALSAHR